MSGKGSVDIAAEIEDLDFVVEQVSQHICRPCLSLITQRINHRTKLANLNAKLLSYYQGRARERGMTIKTKLSAKRALFSNVDSCASSSCQMESMPYSQQQTSESSNKTTCFLSCPGIILSRQDFTPVSTSTPCKNVSVQTATSDIPQSQQSHQASETVVSLKVQWKSKTSNRVLPDDLTSLGKMMLRGTYSQIARAAWRNEKIKKTLVSLLLKEINKECFSLCSSKNPSILRDP